MNWTLKDLELNRMDDATLSNERAMKNYQRGDCSAALYVRNLSKTVIAEDLAAVFGATLPPPFASEYVLQSCAIAHVFEAHFD